MRKKSGFRQGLLGYLMIAPFFAVFLFVYFLPVLQTIWNSFTDRRIFEQPNFIGLDNYIQIFKDPYFIKSVGNTLIYVLFSHFGVMIIGLCLALLVNSKLIKAKVFRATYFLPHVASMVGVSIIWIWMLDPTKGFINYFLNLFGIDGVSWLSDSKWALPAIIIMGIWKGVGYNMLVNLAGLQGVDETYYEAALVDGANRWQTFWKITFPLISPTTFFLFVTGMINSFSMFEQVNVMTGGGPMNATTTIVHQIYTRAFLKYQMGYASAESVLLMLLMGVFVFIAFRFGKQGNSIEE